MPVGTGATVKAMFPEDVAATGADIILANTYHLMLRPGAERIAQARRPAPIHALGRSRSSPTRGGYQVMSLAKLRRIDETGVTFQSHIDGATVALTPERADRGAMPARLRHPDGARRMHAVSGHARRGQASLELSLRWAERSQGRVRELRRAGPSLVRHRAGQHLSRSARAERPRADRDRLRRLRGRRACGRRRAGRHARHGRGRDRDAARRPAALSDGRRHAGGSARSRSRAASTCSTA